MIRRIALAVVLALVPGLALAETCNWKIFESKIGWLKPDAGFSFTKIYPDYHRPVVDQTRSVPPRIIRAFHDAFEIATPFMKQRLCRLDGVFFTPTDRASSWGFREHPRRFDPENQPEKMNEYIAVQNIPPPFQDYESLVMGALLNPLYPNAPKYSLGIGVIPDRAPKPNDWTLRVLALLAALAHEDGHILYQQHYWKVPGDPPFDPNDICEGQYFSGSWKDPDLRMSRAFNIQRSEHLNGIQTGDILNTTMIDTPKNRDKAVEMTVKLMQSGDWISLLSTFTPEHDWVEMIRFVELTRAANPLRSMAISIPVGDQNVIVDPLRFLNEQTEVARKYKCISDYLTRQTAS